MGLFESITHKEEIQNLIDDAIRIYDNATKRFEAQKEQTTKSLEELGKVKVKAWSDGMDKFVGTFGAFKNIEIDRKTVNNNRFIGYDEEPKQMLINIENATMNAQEITKVGIAAVGTGALVGVAVYGGAMMFGTASTGTAIATLSGAAKKNATLAWFGGGAKAVGGLGMAAGKLVLAGIVVAPILGVAAIIAGAKGKEKLAEAKKIHTESENAVSQIDIMTTGMKGIATMSVNYSTFIKKLNKIFLLFIAELERIKSTYPIESDGFINFDNLDYVEQKTVHISWLMAQINYKVLSTPILNSQGEVSSEATRALNASAKELKQIRKDTYKMVGVDAPVGNLIWQPIANKILVINFIAITVYLSAAIISWDTNVVQMIVLVLCSVIACPVFFKFKDLPASRLFTWRLFRLIASVVVLLVLLILF